MQDYFNKEIKPASQALQALLDVVESGNVMGREW